MVNVILMFIFGLPLAVLRFLNNLRTLSLVWSWLKISPYKNNCIVIYRGRLYSNMKRSLVEVVAYRKLDELCRVEHRKGLFLTGKLKHGGIYNTELNEGGYYSSKATYLSKKFINVHGGNYFFSIDNPSSKFIDENIKNEGLRNIIKIWGDYDVMFYIEKSRPGYYGGEEKLKLYHNVTLESYEVWLKMKLFLNKVAENKRFIEEYRKDDRLQEAIRFYKNNNFDYIIDIDNEINILIEGL